MRMLREFVGSHYSDNGAPHEVLVNLLNMCADAYTIGLAAHNPKVMVGSDYRQLAPFANRFEVNINNFIEEIRFAEILRQVVLDAFFTGGVAKVFLAEWKAIQLEDDVWADPGRPYVKRIGFDSFGMDMSVDDVRRCKYMWDEYRVSWQSVLDDPDFDKSVVKQLAPTSKWDRDDEQANQISTGALVDDDEYGPMTDLMDVWLPDLEKVGVFSKYHQTKPLKLVEAGPEGGPYKWLSFADVPDNLIPSSPAHNLMGLHLLYNGLLRKQARQARRQKTNPIYRPGAADDASRLQRVNDGDWVKVQDPSAVGVLSQGGVDQTNVAFSLSVLDLFDRQAGNLKAMAGLGQQAGTLGQEELIYSAVSRKEAKMQQRVHEFIVDVMTSIGHLMWRDSMLEIESNQEVYPGSQIYVPTTWTPEHREGDIWQYKFDVEPYSSNYVSPEAKAQKMERAVQFVASMFPILQANGGTIDVKALVRHYAKALRLPELEDVITFAMPTAAPEGQAEQRMPQETTRNYVRRNVPTGGTPESRSATLQQSLLRSGSETPQQMAALTQ
jgi:hypothetical protein